MITIIDRQEGELIEDLRSNGFRVVGGIYTDSEKEATNKMITITDLERLSGTHRFDIVVNDLIYKATCGIDGVTAYDAAVIAEESGEYYLADLLYAAHGMES